MFCWGGGGLFENGYFSLLPRRIEVCIDLYPQKLEGTLEAKLPQVRLSPPELFLSRESIISLEQLVSHPVSVPSDAGSS
jgi:hypothetical protein